MLDLVLWASELTVERVVRLLKVFALALARELIGLEGLRVAIQDLVVELVHRWDLIEQEELELRLRCIGRRVRIRHFDLFGACELFLDLVQGSFDEVFTLEVEVLVPGVADGEGDQEVQQLVALQARWVLVYPAQYLSYLLHVDVVREADVGDRLQKVCEHGLHLLAVRRADHLVEVALEESRQYQILMRRYAQQAALVLNTEFLSV